jgi:hypothetical protein
MGNELDPVEERRDELADVPEEKEEAPTTDTIFMVWLPKSGAKPRHPSATLFNEEALRSLFLGILANEAFPPGYEFICSADDKNATRPTLESLLGTAIYRKRQGKLWTLMATGPFEGLLERLFPSHQQ